MRADGPYWDAVGAGAATERRHALWRLHSDAVNSAWLAPRLSAAPVERLLKTDLFDESVADGLRPLLVARTRVLVGIDVAASAIATARRRDGRLAGVAADVRAVPFADGTFDTVVSNSTLDHFPSATDVAASLRELHRVLRPGGRLLLTLDNFANPAVAVRNALPFRPLHAAGIVPYHVGWTCGPRRLARLVREAGFAVVEIGAMMHCPRVVAVAASRIVERWVSAGVRRRFLAGLMGFERLEGWPTRFVTGYFVGVVATKGAAAGASAGANA
ncbi:MAG TPA: class I SAM-dependent methyltransferase [Candidatus Binatia bacterium]|nr:class I SAM-dependent methyltransferase [Candidatus Binatia bacterium]